MANPTGGFRCGPVRNQVKSLKLTPECQLPRVRAQARKKYNIQVAEPDEAAAADEE